MTVAATPHLFTVHDYHQMANAGILSPDDRVELIEGQILEMAAVGSRHFSAVNELDRIFQRQAGDRAMVSGQGPVRLDEHSEPEPDIALLALRSDRYRLSLPGPGEVFLLVEVADSTLAFDRNSKVPLYARAGIPEVWIVDIGASTIEAYRGPRDGGYEVTLVVGRDGAISPLAFPDVVVQVADVVG